MHICHINLSREMRGGEQQTIALVRALASSRERLQQSLIVREGSDFHTHCTALNGLELRPVPSSTFRAVLAARDADIIHVHEGRSTRVGALLSLFGIPFLITRRIPNRPKDFVLTKWVYSRAAVISCVSDHVAEIMKDYSPANLVGTNYDCVRPLRADLTVRDKPKSAELTLGVVGEIDFSHKGQDILVPAARILADRGIAVKFLVAGTGRDDSRLRALTEDLDNFEYLGWVDDISTLLLDIDAVVHPSRKEGLGSVLLEAMSLGKPAIAAAVGGVPEIISHGQNGLLVKPESSGQFADAIASLAEDRRLLARLADNAKSTSQRFSPERMADEYLDLYKQMVTVGGIVPSSP